MNLVMSSRESLPVLPARKLDCHKGDFGRVLIVGGARGMSGAVALAGSAAVRSGAGLVTLAVPRSAQAAAAAFEPSCMTVGLPEANTGRFSLAALPALRPLLRVATVLAVGPGLGRSPAVTALACRWFLEASQPGVFDADALFALAQRRELLSAAPFPRILTPHAGELARLTGVSSTASRQELEAAAVDLARRWQCVVLFKGPGTLVTDGKRVSKNATGNPGLATGGAGDVLTGVVAALLAQGLDAFDAARLAAHVHGLAADLAAQEIGMVGFAASDLPRFLPLALAQRGTLRDS